MSGRGVERILDLIEWFAAHPGTASLTQVAAALGMPKSSALQMLRTMTERGYLERDPAGDYVLRRLPGEISGDGRNYGALLALAAPLIEKAVLLTQESGFLAVMDGTDIRYLNKILPDREIRYDRNIAITRPAHKVASGIVILAAGSDEAIADYAARLPEPEAEDLARMIAMARRDGVYLNPRGVIEGAAGAAAAILSRSGTVLGAINISGPQSRMTAAGDSVCKVVHDTARAVTEEIARRATTIM
ncbi:IclR family transcriptional regulator [Paracoccus nototheniae]|uniref:IclR family transcriptional regulator n=1 Tax=Paracoccus nototheniae TaxID=2489002 RepID=A0ABW4DSE2_9RHOB|nr:helix-turn-helix domain-containing protein [Paracoccus nototheniae]